MQAALSISTVTICFIAYYFSIHSQEIHSFFIKAHGESRAKSTWVFSQRLSGVFFFGVVPLIISMLCHIKFSDIGLTFKCKSPIWGWILGLSSICVIVNYFACRKHDHLEMYPQIRTPQPWGKDLMFYSSLTLVFYTLAYEIMFRGYLLFTCEAEMGRMLAIVVNTSVYTLVHIPKGWKETVGAVPMGIILCWLTLESGNIWIAVFVHIALALSSEWFSISHHQRRLKMV